MQGCRSFFFLQKKIETKKMKAPNGRNGLAFYKFMEIALQKIWIFSRVIYRVGLVENT